jgi:hypothetical protein
MERAHSPESQNHRQHGKGALPKIWKGRDRLDPKIIDNIERALCLNPKIIDSMERARSPEIRTADGAIA